MAKWKLDNHIIGKAYDLNQENMNSMIRDIESLLLQNKDLMFESIRYRLSLDLCASMAGHPDPQEACRLVIKTVKEATEEEDGRSKT